MTTKYFTLVFSLVTVIASCTTTVTKSKPPSFVDINKVQQELTQIVKSAKVNLSGSETTSDKNESAELQISITNVQNVPTNDNDRKSFGKLIATTVKHNLKDKNEYNSYSVLFVNEVEENGIMKRKWIGDVFESKEL